MNTSRFGFKTKLILFLEVFVIILNFSLGYLFWQELQSKVRDISRQKLISIAAISAAMIDPEKHAAIKSPEDSESQNYLEIQSELKKIKQANPEVDDIYTLKPGQGNDTWSFVVSASDTVDKNGNGLIEEEEKRVDVGENFDVSSLPEMKQSLFSPTADQEINCDKWGCWLSGYAPLKNSTGRTIGVVGVDISADDVVNFEAQSKMFFGTLLLFAMLILPIGLYIFLRILLRPINRIMEGVEQFGSNLATRINLRTGDEFEMIADTFNMMAQQLEGLYLNLEKNVKEKTLALAAKIEEITKEKAKDEALLESIGEGVVAVDQAGKIILINTQAKRTLGLVGKDVLGCDFEEAVIMEDEKGDSVNKEKRPLSLALKEGEKIVANQYYYQRNKNRFPVFIVATPVKFKNKIIGAIIIFRDISEEKRIDQAKTEFVSLASHQLRTPLSSISWYAEMLLDGDAGVVGKGQKKYLEKIVKSSAQMTDLVRELLNVSRLELGTFMIENKPVNAGVLLKEVLDEFREELKVKHLETNIELKKDSSPINSDPKLLRIIFQNLISNSIKYTPENGKITLTVDIGPSKNSDGQKGEELVSFAVSDTGFGIPQDQQKEIFTKFFRGDNIKEQEIEGTGLGLYIVKSIVEYSGGSIGFKSEKNQGTTFKVSFPVSGMKEKKGEKQLS